MDKVETAVFELIIKNKVFAKCPCGKYMNLFEIYNAHCSSCGNINPDEILIVDLLSDD